MGNRIAVGKFHGCPGLHNEEVRHELFVDLVYDSIGRRSRQRVLTVRFCRINRNVCNWLTVSVEDIHVNIATENHFRSQNQDDRAN